MSVYSVYNDVLNAVISMVNTMTPSAYADVVVGSLPPNNGISMTWGSGSLNTFMDKNAAVEMIAVLNGKHTNQQIVSDTLGQIHIFLNMRKDYPADDNFQITNIETISPPCYLGREENNQWLYGSSLAVKFFCKKG